MEINNLRSISCEHSDFKVQHTAWYSKDLRPINCAKPIGNLKPFSLQELCVPVVLQNIKKYDIVGLHVIKRVIESNKRHICVVAGYAPYRKIFFAHSIISDLIHRKIIQGSISFNYIETVTINPKPFCMYCTKISIKCPCELCSYLKNSGVMHNGWSELQAHQMKCLEL